MKREMGFYEYFIKRLLDIICSTVLILLLGWLFALIALLVRIRMGSPVIFIQPRPGLVNPCTGKEKIFDMYKFRSMTDARDGNGNLLPDAQRLPRFGAWLRRTSLDELPELINILRGDMSLVGPRPQLVRDLVFMDDRQRLRHTARPGLTGLAQVRGRNGISWEEKLDWDLVYIEKVCFTGDLRILLDTVRVALFSHRGITDGQNATALDYGVVLLEAGKVTQESFNEKQACARALIAAHEQGKR